MVKNLAKALGNKFSNVICREYGTSTGHWVIFIFMETLFKSPFLNGDLMELFLNNYKSPS